MEVPQHYSGLLMKLILKLVALFAAGVILLWFAAGAVIPPASAKALEQGSTYALGVPTTIESIDGDLGLSSSGLAFNGLRVANPAGFGDDPFLGIRTLSATVGTMSVLSDTVQVPSITLDGFELNLVQVLERSNAAVILGNLAQLSSGDSTDETPDEPSSDVQASKVLDIERVDITGVKTSFRLELSPGVEKKWEYELPPLHLDFSGDDRSSEMTLADLSAEIVDEVLRVALEQAEGVLPADAMAQVNAAMGDLEGKAKSMLEEAADGLEEDAKKAFDKGIGDLFKKD